MDRWWYKIATRQVPDVFVVIISWLTYGPTLVRTYLWSDPADSVLIARSRPFLTAEGWYRPCYTAKGRSRLCRKARNAPNDTRTIYF